MADYKFTQQSGTNWKANTSDKADAYEDTNEIRAVVDDLGAALGHSKKDGSFPEDLTSGGKITQISFPATQVPSAGENVLDDYEEGTWTGALIVGTSGTITMDANVTGSYTKIGRQVTVTGYFDVDSVSSPVGALTLTGLPFTCATGAQFYAAVSVKATGLENTAITSIIGQITANTTVVALFRFEAGDSVAMAGDVKAGSVFIISAIYFTN